MYKFQRCSKGQFRGAYGHPHFVRGRSDLCHLITRNDKVSVEDLPKSFMTSPKQRALTIDDSLCTLKSKDAKDPSLDLSPYDTDLARNGVSLHNFNGIPPDILDEIINTFADH
jgi:hypothetical protein